jgi:hypothetical protein
MSLNHVTYHVPPNTLYGGEAEAFFTLLGFKEISADDTFEHGWAVRWFKDAFSEAPPIHLVEGIWSGAGEGFVSDQDLLALGHFCVLRPQRAYNMLKASRFCVRDSGSGRIWLQFANLRVEVRPLGEHS